jgi:hypothetical protein
MKHDWNFNVWIVQYQLARGGGGCEGGGGGEAGRKMVAYMARLASTLLSPTERLCDQNVILSVNYNMTKNENKFPNPAFNIKYLVREDYFRD